MFACVCVCVIEMLKDKSNKKITVKHYFSPNTSQSKMPHHPFPQLTERKERQSRSAGKVVKHPYSWHPDCFSKQ